MKERKESKRHFKSQVENYEISVCLYLPLSQYVFLFLDNMGLICK